MPETTSQRIARLEKDNVALRKTVQTNREIMGGLKSTLMNIEMLSRSQLDRARGSDSDVTSGNKRKRRRISSTDDEESAGYGGYDESASGFDFGNNNLDDDDDEEDDEEEDEDDEMEEDEDEGAIHAKDIGLPEPMFLREEMVYRCIECAGEVCDGMCQFCGKLYSYEVPPENSDNPQYYSSVLTEDTFLQTDRLTQRRGTTPVREEEAAQALASRRSWKCPHVDWARDECTCLSDRQYSELIGRGATHAMIEAFQMEFSEAEGLIAWADEVLFEEFTTDVMAPGDKWKIHLGRRIYLSHNDIDGSIFMEDLIDEIIFSRDPRRWSTLRTATPDVYASVWVTKPRAYTRNADGDDDGGGVSLDPKPAIGNEEPLLIKDWYDSEDDIDIDEELEECEVTRTMLEEIGMNWVEDEKAKRRHASQGHWTQALAMVSDADWELGSDSHSRSGSDEEENDQEVTVQDFMPISHDDGEREMEAEEMDELKSDSDSDKPGSDWDSNDDIESVQYMYS